MGGGRVRWLAGRGRAHLCSRRRGAMLNDVDAELHLNAGSAVAIGEGCVVRGWRDVWECVCVWMGKRLNVEEDEDDVDWHTKEQSISILTHPKGSNPMLPNAPPGLPASGE